MHPNILYNSKFNLFPTLYFPSRSFKTQRIILKQLRQELNWNSCQHSTVHIHLMELSFRHWLNTFELLYKSLPGILMWEVELFIFDIDFWK